MNPKSDVLLNKKLHMLKYLVIISLFFSFLTVHAQSTLQEQLEKQKEKQSRFDNLNSKRLEDERQLLEMERTALIPIFKAIKERGYRLSCGELFTGDRRPHFLYQRNIFVDDEVYDLGTYGWERECLSTNKFMDIKGREYPSYESVCPKLKKDKGISKVGDIFQFKEGGKIVAEYNQITNKYIRADNFSGTLSEQTCKKVNVLN